MKKSLLAMLLAVALAVPAMAEGMWIGGSVSYDNTNVKDTSSNTAWEIAPEFGMNVNEKWDLGVAVSYASEQAAAGVEGFDFKTLSDDNVTKADVKKMGVAPFARYKLMSIGKFNVFAKGSVFYNNYKVKADKDVDINSYGLEIVPVVEYSICDTLSVSAAINVASIGYNHSKVDVNGNPEKDTFGLNVNDGVIANIGVAYHF